MRPLRMRCCRCVHSARLFTVKPMTKTQVTEVNELKCWQCGRVGTRAFVQAISGGPSWMGPWRCRWTGPCDRRREAAELASRPEPAAELVGAVDLDVMQEEEAR